MMMMEEGGVRRSELERDLGGGRRKEVRPGK